MQTFGWLYIYINWYWIFVQIYTHSVHYVSLYEFRSHFCILFTFRTRNRGATAKHLPCVIGLWDFGWVVLLVRLITLMLLHALKKRRKKDRHPTPICVTLISILELQSLRVSLSLSLQGPEGGWGEERRHEGDKEKADEEGRKTTAQPHPVAQDSHSTPDRDRVAPAHGDSVCVRASV